jgi:hypothetical protein
MRREVGWNDDELEPALTAAAIEWLRSIGCNVVRLQASSAGRKL